MQMLFSSRKQEKDEESCKQNLHSKKVNFKKVRISFSNEVSDQQSLRKKESQKNLLNSFGFTYNNLEANATGGRLGYAKTRKQYQRQSHKNTDRKIISIKKNAKQSYFNENSGSSGAYFSLRQSRVIPKNAFQNISPRPLGPTSHQRQHLPFRTISDKNYKKEKQTHSCKSIKSLNQSRFIPVQKSSASISGSNIGTKNSLCSEAPTKKLLASEKNAIWSMQKEIKTIMRNLRLELEKKFILTALISLIKDPSGRDYCMLTKTKLPAASSLGTQIFYTNTDFGDLNCQEATTVKFRHINSNTSSEDKESTKNIQNQKNRQINYLIKKKNQNEANNKLIKQQIRSLRAQRALYSTLYKTIQQDIKVTEIQYFRILIQNHNKMLISLGEQMGGMQEKAKVLLIKQYQKQNLFLACSDYEQVHKSCKKIQNFSKSNRKSKKTSLKMLFNEQESKMAKQSDKVSFSLNPFNSIMQDGSKKENFKICDFNNLTEKTVRSRVKRQLTYYQSMQNQKIFYQNSLRQKITLFEYSIMKMGQFLNLENQEEFRRTHTTTEQKDTNWGNTVQGHNRFSSQFSQLYHGDSNLDVQPRKNDVCTKIGQMIIKTKQKIQPQKNQISQLIQQCQQNQTKITNKISMIQKSMQSKKLVQNVPIENKSIQHHHHRQQDILNNNKQKQSQQCFKEIENEFIQYIIDENDEHQVISSQEKEKRLFDFIESLVSVSLNEYQQEDRYSNFYKEQQQLLFKKKLTINSANNKTAQIKNQQKKQKLISKMKIFESYQKAMSKLELEKEYHKEVKQSNSRKTMVKPAAKKKKTPLIKKHFSQVQGHN